MAETVLTQEATPETKETVTATAEQAASKQDESTLLGATDKPAVKEPTAEEKAAAEAKTAQEAADKKLMEADDKTLSKEDLAKKQELIKTAEGNKIPDKYEFKVPEGMTLDTGLVDKLSPIMKELKITQAQAQKLVDVYAPHVAAQVKAQQDEAMKVFEGIKTDWKGQTNKLLGTEPAKELSYAAKFINKFGTPELRQMLNDTGVGNHPELVKIMIAAGKAISEDTMPGGKKIVNKEGGIDTEVFYSHPTSPK